MAQPFVQLDGVTLAPEEAGTRSIDRDSNDKMRFIDPDATTGLILKQLANLSTIGGTFLVGKSGTGAQYTTIQAALDAVPTASSLTSPNVVLVLPGTYTENVTINKNGVSVISLGHVTVAPAAAQATVLIQAGGGAVPQNVRLQGLTITQTNAGEECVYINGGAASNVAAGEVLIQDCDLQAIAATYTVRADTVNNVRVEGGTWASSSASSLCTVSQCAAFRLRDVQTANAIYTLSYDSGGTLPSGSGGDYELFQSEGIGTVTCTLSGGGTLQMKGVESGNLTLNGDQTVSIEGSTVGTIAVNGTVAATVLRSRRGASSGAGTLDESVARGSAVFAGDASQAVAFDVDKSSANYTVVLDYDTAETDAGHPAVTARAATGFTITVPNTYTGTIRYLVMDDALVAANS